MLRLFEVREQERGLLFRNREFGGLLRPGRHPVFDPLLRARVDLVSVREPLLKHPDLEVVVRSGALAGEAQVVDLADHERALVSVDGRLAMVLKPGLHALWTVFHTVKVEVLDARGLRLEHERLPVVLGLPGAREALEPVDVEAGHLGVFFREGRAEATLPPGTHALWKGLGRARVTSIDLREQVLDVGGQDIMTADKVTLRLNAVVVFKVVDAVAAATRVDDVRQALYRETQLALRGAVGTRELDGLLADKDALGRELAEALGPRAAEFGVGIVTLGIRDVILPGEMKDLLNKVTEARKAAEANLIVRREEVAAMRMQMNTARMLQESPTLMRLRELEVLERVAAKGNLQVFVGEKGLTDKVVKLL
jgi:regulator of protease activity HflC (stomatin/prohibitin superfamily)